MLEHHPKHQMHVPVEKENPTSHKQTTSERNKLLQYQPREK